MDILIQPKKLAGSVRAVSSKSFAHRQITAAMLCDGETEITVHGFSDDVMRTLSCVSALGGDYRINGDRVYINPIKAKVQNVHLDCGESGATARIMLPVCAVAAQKAVLIGKGRLPERPFSEMTQLLRNHGCDVSSDTLPIEISGTLKNGDFSIRGDVSSQYITGLLLALSAVQGNSRITLTGTLKSPAYVDITIQVLKDFGVEIIKTDTGYNLPGGNLTTPGKLIAEGDWSNAAFWIVAGALGSKVDVTNLRPDSVQGDRCITQLLDDMEIDVDKIPDLFPVLAVLAAGRCGKTTLYNASRLRLKESDRIESVFGMLKALGCEVEKGEDYLTVFGTGDLRGGVVDGCNDHRIVMSAAIAATIANGPVKILGAEAVNKSYPSFFEEYIRLGGEINVI